MNWSAMKDALKLRDFSVGTYPHISQQNTNLPSLGEETDKVSTIRCSKTNTLSSSKTMSLIAILKEREFLTC